MYPASKHNKWQGVEKKWIEIYSIYKKCADHENEHPNKQPLA